MVHRENHAVSHSNFFDNKFVQEWTDLAVEEARSIDDILTSSDEDEKGHMGPHSLGADDSVEVLEQDQESALSNSIGEEASPASVTSASPSRKKPIETFLTNASPARKRPFKPVSLLNRFNSSVTSENDSGLGESDQSSECSPVQRQRPPSIRVRSFAATSSRNNMEEPDISVISPIVIPEAEMETNNSTSQMFMDIFSSPSLQGSADNQEHRGNSQKTSRILDDSIQEISESLDEEEHVISMEASGPNMNSNIPTGKSQRNKHIEEMTDSDKNQKSNNQSSSRIRGVAEESDDDIVMLDLEKTPVTNNSKNIEIMDQELSAKVNSFVSHLRSKRKFTSTPKSTKSKVITDEEDDGIEIVDIL